MSKRGQNKTVRCRYFTWRLRLRDGVWQADGRSNDPEAGRHSLETRNQDEAIELLKELDLTRSIDLGLAAELPRLTHGMKLLSLSEGRRLYEDFIRRPRVAGGVSGSTQKRYRTVFDKFFLFAKERNVVTWNGVLRSTLDAYASHLHHQDYADKTLRNELTTIVQAQKWLIKEGHLTGIDPLRLSLKKVESQRAYCYTPKEVEAIVQHCKLNKKLQWLASVAIALAHTGLRISELTSLRWADIDFEKGMLSLTHDASKPGERGQKRRELKSGRSRYLPLHETLVAELRNLPRRGPFVFYGPRGGVLKPDTVRNVFVREVIKPLSTRFPSSQDERGFKDGRLHSFRHCFASHCANLGIAERIVMDWLGHQDSEMVRHYYHLHDEESQRQMQRLSLLSTKARRHVQRPRHSAGAKEQKAS